MKDEMIEQPPVDKLLDEIQRLRDEVQRLSEPKVRRIVHAVFKVSVADSQKQLALELANKFLDWARTQTDVYIRWAPTIMEDEHTNEPYLYFRAGFDRDPDAQLPGKFYESCMAYEEVVRLNLHMLREMPK